MMSRAWGIYLIIAAASAAGHLSSLRGGFVSDDLEFVVQNPHIRKLSHLPQAFYSRAYYSSSGKFSIYRPIASATFAVDYAVWGLKPLGFHLTNLVFHTLNACLVLAVARWVLTSHVAALLAAMLFALHPMQTEAVTWVAGRSNTLFLFFSLLSFLAFARGGVVAPTTDHRPPTTRPASARSLLVVSLAFYALALLSKEMAIVLPLLLLLYALCFARPTVTGDEAWKNERTERSTFNVQRSTFNDGIQNPKSKIQNRLLLAQIAPFFAVAAVYVVVRSLILGETSQKGYWGTGAHSTFVTMLAAVGEYMRLLVLPVHPNIDHPIRILDSLREPAAWVSLLVILSALALAIRAPAPSGVRFGILWFFIGLLPVSNIVPLQATLAERFLYLPSLGFCFSLAAATSLLRGQRQRLALAGVLCAATLTIHRNLDWLTGPSLWKSTILAAPQSEMGHNNLGMAYSAQKNLKRAVSEYERALRTDPRSILSHMNLASACLELGRPDDALKHYAFVPLGEPKYVRAYKGLGDAYRAKGMMSEAEAAYRAALSVAPLCVEAMNDLGSMRFASGQAEEALALYAKAVDIDPDFAEAHFNLGNALYKLGRFTEAANSYRRCLRLDATRWAAHQNIGNACMRLSALQPALAAYQDALTIRPDAAETLNALAACWLELGEPDRAVPLCQRALVLQPNYAEAWFNLGQAYSRKGQRDEAAKCFQNALMHWQGDEGGRQRIQEALRRDT